MFNSILNFADGVCWNLIKAISTIWMRIILFSRGIGYGRSPRFYGVAKFKRARNGSIAFGHNCTFRSMATSNLIGINRPCIISALVNGSVVIIGSNCGFSGTVIGCFDTITIGDNVICGANTLITDGDWHSADVRSSPPKKVIIENGVWLGVNVTVLKGVTIGANSVIGAGSMVVKDIPANVYAAGNPCRVIKSIT